METFATEEQATSKLNELDYLFEFDLKAFLNFFGVKNNVLVLIEKHKQFTWSRHMTTAASYSYKIFCRNTYYDFHNDCSKLIFKKDFDSIPALFEKVANTFRTFDLETRKKFNLKVK